MKKTLLTLLTAGYMLFNSLSSKAQTVSGQITDVLNTNPIFNAYVQLESLGSDSTDENGYYTITNTGVNDPVYTMPNTLPEKVKIYNNNGQEVNTLENITENTIWNLTNNSGSTVASGVYFLCFFNKNNEFIVTNKASVLGGDAPVRLSVPKTVNTINHNESGRKIDTSYILRITHPDYYLFENPVEINGGILNMPVIPINFDINFLHEVGCGGQPPNYLPILPLCRWMNNPKIYFSPVYPAPDQEYQNIVENVILNDLPEFTNGVIVPEITTNSNDWSLIVGFVPQNLLPAGAGGMHGEYFENPLNPNEITMGSVSLGNFITNNNSRRSIALHELSQCLINGLDTEIYNMSVFAGYGPLIINYLPQDLDLGKIIHSYVAGTWP